MFSSITRVAALPGVRRRTQVGLLAAAMIGGAAAPAVGATTATHTWYVSAAAAPGGNGTQKAPFNTLAAVEQASVAGDTIIVMPSGPTLAPLDGGIALKPNQHLIGSGPSVVGGSLTNTPRITNTSATQHNGDAVQLASGDEVTNLVITGAYRGGIYGNNVAGVNVHGNDVTAYNTSCADGFFIAPFTFPTGAPGVGAPLTAGLKNGFAGIMLDASTVSGSVTISQNRVHDAACGDGIDLRLSGTAKLTASIAHNTVNNLNNGGDHQSVLAIGAQTSNSASLTANLSYNSESYVGGLESDSEGFFGYPSDTSHLTMSVDHNTFAHGVGGIGPNGRSANGMEFVILSGAPTASMSITNSSFYDTSGDLMEELNWGVNSTMHLSLANVTASHSTGAGDSTALPFNNGDCLLESSAGSGTTTTLSATGTHLSDCANNGLTVHNNVVNGSGPAANLAFDVRSSSIHGNRGDNLKVTNLTGLTKLTGRTEGTNLTSATGTDIAFQQSGTTGSTALDLGGGALGSAGGNCITGGGVADAQTNGFTVQAAHNWWGSPTGPGTGRVIAVNGTITTSPNLSAAPTSCSL
ncbi:MAG: hypothetical protein ACXVYS_01760 [Oryzihumus sp.]